MYFFPHIPKAGGTTLRNLFYQAFGTKNCLRVWNPKAGAQVSAKDFEHLTEFKECAVILGHLSVKNFMNNEYAKAKLMRGEVKILTAVREPIDRLISLYNFIRVNSNHPMHSEIQNIAATDFLFSQQPNFQTGFLSTNTGNDINAIFSQMTIFPLEQSISLLKKHLEETLDITLNNIEPKNRTADRPGASNLFERDMLSSYELEKLTQAHSLDMELYLKSQYIFKAGVLP